MHALHPYKEQAESALTFCVQFPRQGTTLLTPTLELAVSGRGTPIIWYEPGITQCLVKLSSMCHLLHALRGCNALTMHTVQLLHLRGAYISVAAGMRTHDSLEELCWAQITVYFADYISTGAGQNVFNIVINGNTLETGVDVYALGGGSNQAVSFGIPVNSGSRNSFDISFPTTLAVSVLPHSVPTLSASSSSACRIQILQYKHTWNMVFSSGFDRGWSKTQVGPGLT